MKMNANEMNYKIIINIIDDKNNLVPTKFFMSE